MLPSRHDARRVLVDGLLCLAIACRAPRGRPTTRWRAPACSTTSGSSTRRCSAAEEARLTPARADSADLVAARAYLERFRESAASDDLDQRARAPAPARSAERFGPRERVEYHRRPRRDAVLRRGVRRGGRPCSTRCCEPRRAGRRGARARARLVGERARSRGAGRGPTSSGRASTSGSATRMHEELGDASRRAPRRPTGSRRRRGPGRSAGGVGRRAGRLGARAARQRSAAPRCAPTSIASCCARSSPTAPRRSAQPPDDAARRVGAVQGAAGSDE